jgi:hypothetical protein
VTRWARAVRVLRVWGRCAGLGTGVRAATCTHAPLTVALVAVALLSPHHRSPPEVVRGVYAKGWERPSKIQAQVRGRGRGNTNWWAIHVSSLLPPRALAVNLPQRSLPHSHLPTARPPLYRCRRCPTSCGRTTPACWRRPRTAPARRAPSASPCLPRRTLRECTCGAGGAFEGSAGQRSPATAVMHRRHALSPNSLAASRS